MNDKEYAKQKARVKKYWDKWFDTIGLAWWNVNITWDRERREDRPSQLGETSSKWQYRSAHVTFQLPEIATVTDERLEECVVHEMTHILLQGIEDFRDDQATQITEYTTTTIARAIIWAREAGQKYSVKHG